MKEKVIKNLQDALVFIGQAQDATPHMSPLWKALGGLYIEIDDQIETIEGSVDEQGEYHG